MTLEEKLKTLGATPLNGVKTIRREIGEGRFHDVDCSRFDYVVWHKGIPFLYSKEYILETDVEKIKVFIEAHS